MRSSTQPATPGAAAGGGGSPPAPATAGWGAPRAPAPPAAPASSAPFPSCTSSNSAAQARGAFRSSSSAARKSLSNLARSEEHTSELQSRLHLVCRLLLEKKKILLPRSVSVRTHFRRDSQDHAFHPLSAPTHRPY